MKELQGKVQALPEERECEINNTQPHVCKLKKTLWEIFALRECPVPICKAATNPPWLFVTKCVLVQDVHERVVNQGQRGHS